MKIKEKIKVRIQSFINFIRGIWLRLKTIKLRKGGIGMLVRLKEYLAVYEQEKRTLELSSDEEVIRQMVAEYEAQVRKDFADKKAQSIATKENEIVAIKGLIEREEAREEKERQAEIANAVTAVETVESVDTNETAEVSLADISLENL